MQVSSEKTNPLNNEPPKKPLKICLVGGGFSTKNLGVSVLTHGIVSSIRNCHPDAEILLADYGHGPVIDSIQVKVGSKYVLVQKLLFRFSKKLYLKNNILHLLFIAWFCRVLPFRQMKAALLRFFPALEMLSQADLVCSIAGGDSFSDLYGSRQLLYVSLPVMIGIGLKKPIVLLPQTYGPFETRFARSIARFIIRRSDIVFSRDHEGANTVAALTDTSSKRVRFSYDMGFALESKTPNPTILKQIENICLKGPLVGLNISGLLYMGGYTRDNMFGLKADYPELINKIIEELILEKGTQVLLVPHVLGENPDSESDQVACAHVYEAHQERFAGNLHYIFGPFNLHTIKYLIGRCDFFMGSRMHACIAALSQGVPSVGLAYSKKFTGVLESLEVGDLVVDLRKNDKEAVIKKVSYLFDCRRLVKNKLMATMPYVREKVIKLFSDKDILLLLEKHRHYK